MKIYQGERVDSENNIHEGFYINTLDELFYDDLNITDPKNAQVWIEPASTHPEETEAVIYINGHKFEDHTEPFTYIRSAKVDNNILTLTNRDRTEVIFKTVPQYKPSRNIDISRDNIISFKNVDNFATLSEVGSQVNQEAQERQEADYELEDMIDEQKADYTSKINAVKSDVRAEQNARQTADTMIMSKKQDKLIEGNNITIRENVISANIPTQSFLPYLTTAPTKPNMEGLKIVVLNAEPTTKYDGYLYIITR